MTWFILMFRDVFALFLCCVLAHSAIAEPLEETLDAPMLDPTDSVYDIDTKMAFDVRGGDLDTLHMGDLIKMPNIQKDVFSQVKPSPLEEAREENVATYEDFPIDEVGDVSQAQEDSDQWDKFQEEEMNKGFTLVEKTLSYDEVARAPHVKKIHALTDEVLWRATGLPTKMIDRNICRTLKSFAMLNAFCNHECQELLFHLTSAGNDSSVLVQAESQLYCLALLFHSFLEQRDAVGVTRMTPETEPNILSYVPRIASLTPKGIAMFFAAIKRRSRFLIVLASLLKSAKSIMGNRPL